MRIINPREIQMTLRVANDFTPIPKAAWSDRIIPDFEFILIRQGQYAFSSENNADLPLKAGDVLTIFPGEKHSFWRVDDDPESKISCIHGEFLPSGTWMGGDYRLNPAPERISRSNTVIDALFARCAEVFGTNSIYHQKKADTTATMMVLELCEQWQRIPLINYEKRIEQAVTYIRAHLDRPITREEIAEELSLSGEHLSRIFTRYTGSHLSRFIQRERIMKAHRLMINEGLNAKEAAFAVGFEDPAYFSRVFKKILFVSPSESIQNSW